MTILTPHIMVIECEHTIFEWLLNTLSISSFSGSLFRSLILMCRSPMAIYILFSLQQIFLKISLHLEWVINQFVRSMMVFWYSNCRFRHNRIWIQKLLFLYFSIFTIRYFDSCKGFTYSYLYPSNVFSTCLFHHFE